MGRTCTPMVHPYRSGRILVGCGVRVSHSEDILSLLFFLIHINNHWTSRLIHLALFLVRCFLSFSYRPWREYRNWTLPRGRFSIEFKVQFIRQSDNAEASPDATASGTGIQAEVAAQRV
jgi:hypothetical protein